VRYERRHIIQEIIVDRRNFKVCEPKEVAEWTWRQLKTKKMIVHFDGKALRTEILFR